MLDLLSTTSSWQPVFYACHDPPVIAYQAATIEDFLRDTVAMWQVDRRSAVDIVHEDVVMQIWRTNPHLQTAARLLESTDAVAQAFAMSLPPQALVIDLAVRCQRNARQAMQRRGHHVARQHAA